MLTRETRKNVSLRVQKKFALNKGKKCERYSVTRPRKFAGYARVGLENLRCVLARETRRKCWLENAESAKNCKKVAPNKGKSMKGTVLVVEKVC